MTAEEIMAESLGRQQIRNRKNRPKMTIRILFDWFKLLLGATSVMSPVRRDVLIVEDVDTDARLIQWICEKQGYLTLVCPTLNSALVALESRDWFCMMVDMNLGQPQTLPDGTVIMQGSVFIEEVLKVRPRAKIVIVTGHAGSLKGSQQFPLICKGSDHAKFDNAISLVLSGDGRAQEMMKVRLFMFVCLLSIASCLIGALAERWNWFPILTAPRP